MTYSIQEILKIVEKDGDFEYPLDYMIKEWSVHSLRFKFHRAFKYDFKTGKLFWKINRKRVKIGDVIKCQDKKGYYIVRFNQVNHLVHRILMIMFNDNYSDNLDVDHIDGNPYNNKLINLRLVSHQINGKNQKIRKNNTSGEMGISWIKNRNRWVVQCTVKGKNYFGGYHTDLNDAIKARNELYIKHDFHPNHGKR